MLGEVLPVQGSTEFPRIFGENTAGPSVNAYEGTETYVFYVAHKGLWYNLT
jgi:hypothetical protein